MLVKHLGGAVSGHCEGCAEVGFYPLQATDAGRKLGEWPEMVYQWHREGFDLPDGATLLARGDIFENQAFAVNDTAFGIQFHSELTYAMACRWTVQRRGALRAAEGAVARRAHGRLVPLRSAGPRLAVAFPRHLARAGQTRAQGTARGLESRR